MDARRRALSKKEHDTMQIKDVMSKPVVTCPVSVTLDQIAQRMWENDIGVIPLVDDRGKVAGVVTDRDICMAAYTQGRALTEIPAASAMAKEVFCCQADDTTQSAEWLMAQKQIRRVPVVDRDGRPLGMLALNDLTRVAADARTVAAEHEVVETLAAIGEPRQAAPKRRASTDRKLATA